MKSHTVPKRLLRQFAYPEASTGSDRLWRYEKDRVPYSKASPDTATRIDGHFADPEDAVIEATIERRLAYEIEDPVNQFIANFYDPSFAMNDEQKRKMTRYVTLLFNRSIARRNATQHLLEIRNNALNHFLSNEIQLETVAAHWNIDAFFKGLRFGRLITREDVVRRAREFVVANASGREAQTWYAQGTLRALAGFDEVLFRGEWRLLSAEPSKTFLLSDTPVITWNRLESGQLAYGVGFHTANVEVFLPISPATCLHILPYVHRTRRIASPTVTEINIAEASFSYNACFASQFSQELDVIVQQHISTVRIGENAFTVFHRNYENTIYDTLMSGGRWADPPRISS
jgi:hypothetical protein